MKEFVFCVFKYVDGTVKLPSYATEKSACFDFFSIGDFVLKSKEITVIPTGLSVAFPEYYELQIRSRSSLAMKGIIIANSPGIIDADYKDEIKIIMYNLTDNDYIIKEGDRIAQGAFFKRIYAPVNKESIKRTGGLGSTGK